MPGLHPIHKLLESQEKCDFVPQGWAPCEETRFRSGGTPVPIALGVGSWARLGRPQDAGSGVRRSSTTPAITSAMPARRPALAGSPNQKKPIVAISPVPSPDQTA